MLFRSLFSSRCSFLRLQREEKSHAINSNAQGSGIIHSLSSSPAAESGSSFFELVQQEDEAIEFVRHKSGRLQPKRATLPKLVELLAHEKGRGKPFALYMNDSTTIGLTGARRCKIRNGFSVHIPRFHNSGNTC